MKFLFQIVAVALATFLLQSIFPWWSVAVGGVLVGAAFRNNGGASFLSGFLGVALVWMAYAYYLDAQGQSILSQKVAALFPTKTVMLLFVLTGVTGGLVGGLSTLTGGLMTYKKKSRW